MSSYFSESLTSALGVKNDEIRRYAERQRASYRRIDRGEAKSGKIEERPRKTDVYAQK